jgi:hypothetical protein
MRVATAIVLSDETRLRLEKLSRGPLTPVRILQRSRIVLLAGTAFRTNRLPSGWRLRLGLAALWHDRFLTLCVDGQLLSMPLFIRRRVG